MSSEPNPSDTDRLLEKACAWLTRMNSGEMGPADQKALAEWRAAAPAHEQAWHRAERLWQGLESLRGRPGLPGSQPLVQELRPTSHSPAIRRPQRRRWLRPALAIACTTLLAVTLYTRYPPISWRRPVGVAMAAALAAVLHGGLAIWFLTRPEPIPVTAAAPLPMIDIALSAPASPTVAQPVEPPPQPPKPEKKPEPAPVKKPKPKPKPVRKESVVKQVEPREKVAESAPAPSAPVRAEASSPRSEAFTPASSDATYLHNPRPVYPGIARSRHWEGLVLLRVYVTPDGRCGEISVQRSSGHEVLDEAALEAVKKWQFVPAKRGDSATASWVAVPIEFRLE